MHQPSLNQDNRLGPFVIDERLQSLFPLNCYRATRPSDNASAWIYVRDLRDSPADRHSLKEFKERAARLQELRLHSLPRLLEADDHDGLRWAAFEFPEGISLREYIWDHDRIDPLEGAILARDIGAVLLSAQDQGVHGMLEIAAIYIDANKRLRHLLHFGIGPLFGISPPPGLYRAPEQWKGEKQASESADIFATATIVWEAIAGDEPFAQNAPDPDREKRIRQRFPALRSAREDVHDLLSNVLFDWTSHEESERPKSWRHALIEMECVIATLNEANQRNPTTAELCAEDSEPPTRPNTARNRRRPLLPPPLEHADTIPAPPPKASISSIPPTPRTAGDFLALPPKSRALTGDASRNSSAAEPAPRHTKRIVGLVFAGFLIASASVVIAWISIPRPTRSQATSIHARELALILRTRASLLTSAKNKPEPTIHNSQVVNDERPISSRRTRAKSRVEEPSAPINRHDPKGPLEDSIYMDARQH